MQYFTFIVSYRVFLLLITRNLHNWMLRRIFSTASINLRSLSTTGPSIFTKDHYDVTRGDFNSVQPKHVEFFRNLLGDQRLLTDLSDLERYNVDWMLKLRGNSSLVLKPKTTEEVSKILNFCNENRLAVCPQGGNTGISGGSVPVFDEIIISTELMNKIESIDETSGILVCQSGCVLETLENELAKINLAMPLDLGAKGSCHIGGNLSTNAGGLRLLRYGNLHGNVLGVEVVKANGEIIDCLSSLKKDNTGYHLKHLFIGSEGTLGFITKVSMQVPIKANSVNLAFLGCQSFAKVLKTYEQAKYDLGEILSAVEVMDSATMEFANEKLQFVSPIGDYCFYLLLETMGRNEKHDAEKLNNFLDESLIKHHTLNGTIATEPSKIKEIWKIRERLAETFTKGSHVYTYDLTFPTNIYYKIVNELRAYLDSKAEKVFGFGHLGDGNLHLQVAVSEHTKDLEDQINKFVYEKTKELGGSISAEHGIGFTKTKYLKEIKDLNNLNLMRDIKILMDPKGILNPYKMIY